jgi:hypothetical protein
VTAHIGSVDCRSPIVVGGPVSVPSVTADTERGRELVANAPC